MSRKAKDIFLMASELSGEAREAYLGEACAGDTSLLQEVESLLMHAARTAGLKLDPERSDAPLEAAIAFFEEPGPPSEIPGYRIVGKVAEGAMGVVYQAKQENPKRTVALKVIKRSFASPETLRRFEYEAQILGNLQHPGIAQVYEAGTFEVDGRSLPFFAMEYIDGENLVDYADAQNLGTRERLALVSKICDAVQHAHLRGVIHRDLKPSNILVDTRGSPKILDFGVARVSNSDIQTSTLRTDIGQLIGTVPYMSPEQTTGKPDDLDARSDVYALGVVTYELLVGQLPYDLAKKMIHEAVRIIQEDSPIPISSINRVLRGDVEILVDKALAKERDRRYQSAGDFGHDIERYLHDEPIKARPPSTWYQLRKFSARHRGLVGGLTAVVLVVVVGIITSSSFAIREAKHRRIAESEAENAQAINNFLTDDLLAAVAPSSDPGRGKDVSMRDVLDEASKRIEAAGKEGGLFVDKPHIEASIRNTLGVTYNQLGYLSYAEPHLERALELRQRTTGNESLATLQSMNTLAGLYLKQARYAEAESLFTETLAACERVLGDEHPDTLVTMNNLAILYRRQGRYVEAEPLILRTFQTRKRVLGDEHTETLESMDVLAGLYYNVGRFAEAEPLMVRGYELQKQLHGAEHPATLIAINNLAVLYSDQARHDQAEPLYLESLEIRTRLLGEEHPNTLSSKRNLGLCYYDLGRLEEAEALLETTFEAQSRVLGPEHPETLSCRASIAALYLRQGRYQAAAPFVNETLDLQRRVLGDEHPETLATIFGLAFSHHQQGRLQEAERLYAELVESQKRSLGDAHPNTLFSKNNLAELYFQEERFPEAEVLQRQIIEGARQAWPEGTWFIGAFGANLGATLAKLQRFEEAERSLNEGYEILVRSVGEQHENVRTVVESFVDVYSAWDEVEPGKGYDAKAGAWRERLLAMQREQMPGAGGDTDGEAD